MKLFEIYYCDDCEFESYLTIGDNEENVLNRELLKLQDECCLMGVPTINEISEINGYKIILENKEVKDIDKVKKFLEEFNEDIVQERYGDGITLETAGGKYWGCSFEFTENGDFISMHSTNDA